MDQEKLNEILRMHAMWLRGEEGGVRAALRRANLRGADLREADLRRANLRGADLRESILTRAILTGANLTRAILTGANLTRANLRGADLRESILTCADLREAALRRANLRGADLRESILTRANLTWADLRESDLRGANLRDADMRWAKGIPDEARLLTQIHPDSGSYEAWKQCQDGVIVRLLIPAESRRSNATGRKLRAECAQVLEVIGAEFGISIRDGETEYRAGEIVRCDEWCDDRWQECAGGIHHFLTRAEAEITS